MQDLGWFWGQLQVTLTWWLLGPNSLIQPMEDAPETGRSAPPEAPCLPWAILMVLYSLVALASYLLEVTSQGLLLQAAGAPHAFPFVGGLVWPSGHH